ncbi:glycosyltransferase family 39 protein [Candidatus Woesebacteria bacterium]|nr:glycosyltransferase family 39 protein [Candidatus Woesebacteria bacterium]
MEKIKNLKLWIKDNPKEAAILGIILLVGAFLRLYKIDQYMTFLGDEGRDVIIVRRLLVYADPILIGPVTSIGNMYLGPLYYYMMAPALLLAGFSPVGPAIQIALLSLATTFFVWFVGREWFGKVAAGVAASLYAIAPTVIIFSRSSWNPNIMPFFGLLSIYSIWRVWSKHQFKWLIVLGISFAAVLQSHYLGLLLAPTLFLFWVLTFRNYKLEIINFLRYSIFGLLLFAGLMSPLVIFDARHGWRNFAAMKEFFTARQTTVSARPWNTIPNFYPLFEKVNIRLLAGRNETVGKIASVAIVLGFSWLFILKRRKNHSLVPSAYLLLFSWLFFALIGLGLYKQQIYDHYFGFFFPVSFLLLGGLANELVTSDKRKVISYIVVIICYLLLVTVNLMDNPLRYSPNRQLQRSIDVAQKITEESNGERFNLAVLAERNYEDGYQYFLEVAGAEVLHADIWDKDTISNQLFVVCEKPKEDCKPTTDAKAEVANFGWSKIENQWDVSGIVLYKLVHSR